MSNVMKGALLVVVALWAVTAVCGCEEPEDPDTPATQWVETTIPARVRVSVRMPGAPAEDIEQNVTAHIEMDVMALPGVAEVRSVSREGISEVDVEFAPRVVADEAVEAVQRAVASINVVLPEDMEAPVVTLMDTGPLAVSIAVHGRLSNAALHALADTLRDRLMSVAGVGRVELTRESFEVRIALSAEALRKYDLPVKAVHQAIRTGSSRPLGSTAIRPVGQHATDVGQIVVAKAGGMVVRLADVARISEGLSDKTTVRIAGKAGALARVHAFQGQDPAAVAQRVRAAVAGFTSQVPEGVRIDIHDCSPASGQGGPLLRVATECPDVPVEAIERDLTGPIGRRLGKIGGVTNIATVSSPGRSMVQVSFDHSTDLQMAIRRVRSELNKRQPATIGGAAPTVEPVPGIPIGRIDVRGGASADDQTKTALPLQRAMYSIVGIARVDAPALELRNRVYEMIVKRERIAAFGLTMEGVTNQARSLLGSRDTVIESASGPLRVVMPPRPGGGLDLDGMVMLAGGRRVPLTELVDFQMVSRPSAVQHVNARRCITLELFGDGARKTEAIIDAVRKLMARAAQSNGGSVEITFQPAAING